MVHKLNIEEMNKIAKSKEGKCLSKEYINTITKLKWQCDKGHTWEARPSHIKSIQGQKTPSLNQIPPRARNAAYRLLNRLQERKSSIVTPKNRVLNIQPLNKPLFLSFYFFEVKLCI